MSSVHTVTRSSARQPLRDARARVVSRDANAAFANVVLGTHLRALTLVTPWVTDQQGGCEAFGRLLDWANRCRATVNLITRPTASEPHGRAANLVLAAGGRVTYNEALHAKIYVAQFSDGRRVALVGSANLTAASVDLLESAILIQSPARRRGPDLIDDLFAVPVRRILSDPRSRTTWRRPG